MTICRSEDLLLQKLQVIGMTTTDLMDSGVLLATHRVRVPAARAGRLRGGDRRAARIAGLLARDWGFHHTATANLAGGPGRGRGRAPVRGGRGRAVDGGPACCWPRSTPSRRPAAWRMRDRIGERKQWWQDVDEKEATY